MHVLVDQVGYDLTAPKQAIVQTLGHEKVRRFALIDNANGKAVLEGDLKQLGAVKGWNDGDYWSADFSSWKKPGTYSLRVMTGTREAHSCSFEINEDLLERDTLSNVVFYFKGQRSSGLFDEADRHLALPGSPGKTVDLHGGWYDATGDYGIHLSHQNPTSYFNPQQVPLAAWSLLKSYDVLMARHDDNFSEYERRMLDEGVFGADYLVRLKQPGGSFFETISAPGKDKLAKDRAIGNPNWRTQIKTKSTDTTENIVEAEGPYTYQASFRAGGGMAIAALALASTMPIDGDFKRGAYLNTAKDAFRFLNAHNRELLNDGKENILDDYCALIAATELYKASKDEEFLSAASTRADHLIARLASSGQWTDYWRADDDKRPYFHPSDAGLPAISLLEYATIASSADREKVKQAVKRSLSFELSLTAEVNNPFGLRKTAGPQAGWHITVCLLLPA